MVSVDWLKLMLKYPLGGLSRLQGQLDRRRDARDWQRVGLPPREFYGAGPDADRRMHELIGAPWPCQAQSDLRGVLQGMKDEFARQALEAGDAQVAYASQSDLLAERFDTDAEVLRATWCATRHLSAARVVETGVARGITSRCILEALDLNGHGELWSIDLPHAETTRFGQIGSAVTDNLRERWTLILGSSRQYLPGLLRQLSEIDLFVHDSLHTGRNVRFEIEEAWSRLRPGGVVIADDVNHSLAFRSFVEAVGATDWVVGERTELGGLWGAIVKPGGGH